MSLLIGTETKRKGQKYKKVSKKQLPHGATSLLAKGNCQSVGMKDSLEKNVRNDFEDKWDRNKYLY